MAGLLALVMWCCSPNILAHAQLITPDLGATALGVAAYYTFWRWLENPGWAQTILAGVTLGLAELTKSTWIVLFALWPIIWLAWRLMQDSCVQERRLLLQAAKLACILLLGILVINVGYGGEGSFKKLGAYRFASCVLGGFADDEPASARLEGRNRFFGTALGSLPVPFPSNYIRGIDVQKAAFEKSRRISYLHGEFRTKGWWYYYLYALACKVPLGTWLLILLSVFLTLFRRGPFVGARNDVVLLSPLLVVLILVSSQTGVNHHLRYVLPIFPFAFIWISRAASGPAMRHVASAIVCVVAVSWSVFASFAVYPHSLCYFNVLFGGPSAGHRHLLDSNIDWGQDLLYLQQWLQDHPEARPMSLAYYGLFDPHIVDSTFRPVRVGPASARQDSKKAGPQPGWCAVSVNTLCGYRIGGLQQAQDRRYAYFQHFQPVAMAGYSIYIYHITLDEANRVRRELGMEELRVESGELNVDGEERSGRYD